MKQQIPADFLVAAVIGPAHGLRGEVTLDVRTDRPEQVLAAGSQLATERGMLIVSRVRTHKGRVYACFEQISSREDAEDARGLQLWVEPVAEADAWYEDELVGLAAVAEGQTLGKVVGLEVGSAQDWLVVDAGGEQVLVPFVEAIVPEVDLEAGVVRMTPPAGLFADPTDFQTTGKNQSEPNPDANSDANLDFDSDDE